MDTHLFRPLTIHDLVVDPTLDPSPIMHSMPPKDRFLPGFSVLVAGSLISLMLVLAPSFFTRPMDSAPRPLALSGCFMDIVLSADPSPVVNGRGSGGNDLSPGKGLIKGPNPSRRVAVSMEDMVPLALPLRDIPSFEERRQGPFSDSPGGDGRPGAIGNGDGRGVGGSGIGKALGKTFDHQLVPRFQPRASYRLKAGESGDNTIVDVEITVEDDGHVSQAVALSGPVFLYPSVCEAAKHWTFEPLGLHGLKGPLKTRIHFTCKLT